MLFDGLWLDHYQTGQRPEVAVQSKPALLDPQL